MTGFAGWNTHVPGWIQSRILRQMGCLAAGLQRLEHAGMNLARAVVMNQLCAVLGKSRTGHDDLTCFELVLFVPRLAPKDIEKQRQGGKLSSLADGGCCLTARYLVLNGQLFLIVVVSRTARLWRLRRAFCLGL